MKKFTVNLVKPTVNLILDKITNLSITFMAIFNF